MASWPEFAAAQPRLAAAVRDLVHQYGPGLGYLATVRPDGGPRVHPVSPVITEEGLFCFILDSPKRRDLERDDRYALHAYPPEDTDDEAYLSGHARPVTDEDRLATLAGTMRAEAGLNWRVYEFSVEVAMVARRPPGGHGPGGASYETWRDTAQGSGDALGEADRVQ